VLFTIRFSLFCPTLLFDPKKSGSLFDGFSLLPDKSFAGPRSGNWNDPRTDPRTGSLLVLAYLHMAFKAPHRLRLPLHMTSILDLDLKCLLRQIKKGGTRDYCFLFGSTRTEQWTTSA
jgi:hypothetical protein